MREYFSTNIKDEIFTPCSYRIVNVGFDLNHTGFDVKIKRIRKAIIPAAGLGTRFLPATKATPKEMLPIVDIPTIQYIVQEAIDSGVEEILIIDNQYKQVIHQHFSIDERLEGKLLESNKQKDFELVRAIGTMA